MSYYEKYQRIEKVIKSCKTQKQFDIANNYAKRYIRKLGKEHTFDLVVETILLSRRHAKSMKFDPPIGLHLQELIRFFYS